MNPPWLENLATVAPRRVDSVASLKQLQEVMSTALYRSLTSDDEMLDHWTDGSPMADLVASFVTPNDRLTSMERLEIYNRQYWFRLLDCLYEDYPGMRALLGEAVFHDLSRAYLAIYPSQSWSLRELGARLVEFIQADPAWTGAKTAMALDVARVEWAQTLAFDEPERPAVKGDDLLGRSPESLRLGLQPYVVLLDLHYGADEFVRKVRRQDSGMRSEASNAQDAAPKQSKGKRARKIPAEDVWLAVYRFDTLVYFLRIEREAFLLLGAMREGKTLLEAVDVALEGADPKVDWSAKLREWFATWAQLGWFCERSS